LKKHCQEYGKSSLIERKAFLYFRIIVLIMGITLINHKTYLRNDRNLKEALIYLKKSIELIIRNMIKPHSL